MSRKRFFVLDARRLLDLGLLALSSVRDYAGDVLVRKSEHLGQQVVVVKVFQVVDLVENLEVFGGNVLNIGHHLFVVDVTGPELSIVVLAVVIDGSLVIDRLIIRCVLKGDFR